MNKHIALKSGILVFTLVFLMMSSQGRLPHEKINYFPLSGDTLSCLILPNNVLGKNRYSIGYHYQILKEFAKAQQCALRLIPLADSVSPWEAMLAQNVHVMITNTEYDSVPEILKGRFIAGPSLNNFEHTWVLLQEDFDVMKAMYTWFNSFKHTEQYAGIASKFNRSQRPRSPSHFARELSPYDDLIKKYSKEIGWDWRLLAALIHQESNFRMHVSSSKGAIGLMQVKEVVAQRYGVDPIFLYDPEQNIKAGSMMLKDLHRTLRDSTMGEDELIKFILAAYNAGPGRIEDCRNFALSQGKDPNNWEEVSGIFPLMSKKEHYQGEHIKIGPFRGNETIAYVSGVLERYQLYRTFTD